MKNKVTREKISKLVIEKLTSFNEPNFDIKEAHRLQRDLNMGSIARTAMAKPYTKISEQYDGFSITQSAAKDLKTVKQSVALVFKKANRKN